MQGEPESHDRVPVFFKLLAMSSVSFCGGTIQILNETGRSIVDDYGNLVAPVALHDGFRTLSENPISFADLLCKLCLFQDRDPFNRTLGSDFKQAQLIINIDLPGAISNEFPAGAYSIVLSVDRVSVSDESAEVRDHTILFYCGNNCVNRTARASTDHRRQLLVHLEKLSLR